MGFTYLKEAKLFQQPDLAISMTINGEDYFHANICRDSLFDNMSDTICDIIKKDNIPNVLGKLHIFSTSDILKRNIKYFDENLKPYETFIKDFVSIPFEWSLNRKNVPPIRKISIHPYIYNEVDREEKKNTDAPIDEVYLPFTNDGKEFVLITKFKYLMNPIRLSLILGIFRQATKIVWDNNIKNFYKDYKKYYNGKINMKQMVERWYIVPKNDPDFFPFTTKYINDINFNNPKNLFDEKNSCSWWEHITNNYAEDFDIAGGAYGFVSRLVELYCSKDDEDK